MQTERKPLKEIIEKLRLDADEHLEKWTKNKWYSTDVTPPDVLAITDQINLITKLAPNTQLPMSMLNRVATTLSTSEDVEKSVIGGVLLQCHAEIKELTDFCRHLHAMKVDYPCQDAKDGEEDTTA